MRETREPRSIYRDQWVSVMLGVWWLDTWTANEKEYYCRRERGSRLNSEMSEAAGSSGSTFGSGTHWNCFVAGCTANWRNWSECYWVPRRPEIKKFYQAFFKTDGINWSRRQRLCSRHWSTPRSSFKHLPDIRVPGESSKSKIAVRRRARLRARTVTTARRQRLVKKKEAKEQSHVEAINDLEVEVLEAREEESRKGEEAMTAQDKNNMLKKKVEALEERFKKLENLNKELKEKNSYLAKLIETRVFDSDTLTNEAETRREKGYYTTLLSPRRDVRQNVWNDQCFQFCWLKVERSEVSEIEHSSVQNGTILKSENDTQDSMGTIIPVDQIPTSAVPASCLSDMHLKRVYKKETRPKKESIANFQPKLSKGRKEVILPGEDYPFALLQHDYIETMSESLKDYIVSKELHSSEVDGSNSKAAQITKQVKDKQRTKTRQRKRRSLLMYSGKTKLERNLYRSHLKRVQMENGTEQLANGVQTRLCSHADDDTPITSEIQKKKIDFPPSGNSLKRSKRRRKRLSLHGGRTKLERNPLVKYRTKIQTPTKPAESVAIEEDSIRNGSLSLKADEDTICNYKKQLVQSMYSMQKSGTFCDFTILAGSPRTQRQFSILVHRLVFASVSNKIKYHKANILDAAAYWNKFDAQRIVEFVYTGNMEGTKTLTQDDIKRLHRAAVFLEIPKCIAYLKAFKKVQTPSIAEIGDCVPLNNNVPDVDASFILPPLLASNSSLDVEVFDIADDIRIESVVSVVCDTTDTSGEEGPLNTEKGMLRNTERRRRRFKKRRPH